MARNHFAIEPPGRIRISIPGYSPEDNLKEQAKRRSEKRKRQQRRDEAAAAEARKRQEAAARERLQQSQSPPMAGDDDVAIDDRLILERERIERAAELVWRDQQRCIETVMFPRAGQCAQRFEIAGLD